MNTESTFFAASEHRSPSRFPQNQTGHPENMPARKRYWHVQLRDPAGELFESRSARFAFLNIWRIYISARYPTCAYVLIPGYFGCILEAPEEEHQPALMQSVRSRLCTKLNGLFSSCLLEELKGGLQLRPLKSVKECMHCTFDMHTLPQRYHISTDYRSYPFSSYRALSGGGGSALKQKTVLDWFGGQLRFSVFHQAYFGWVKPRYGQDISGSTTAPQVAEM